MIRRGIFFVVTIALLLGSTNATSAGSETPMSIIFDDLEQLMTGNQQFDRDEYNFLRTCMDGFDSSLVASQDAAWQGIINYWNSNGTTDDAWGSRNTQYMEHNVTQTNILNMTIYEPCDYSSNFAYYHDVTEFCLRKTSGSPFSLPDEYVRAFGMSFSGLAMGSSFMHMSHTVLGHQQDNWSIRVISYLIHQASLSSLPDVPSILTDFAATPRAENALEITDNFMNMYLNMPVEEWFQHTASIDVPDYYLSFAGLFSTIVTIGFSDEVVDKYIPILADAFSLPDEYLDYIMNIYLPEIRNLTSSLNLGIVQRTKFVENALSATLKLIYSFLWQEERLTSNPIFLNETVNTWGAEMIPVLNSFLNSYNSFEYFETNFQDAVDVYPGDFWCNLVIPHAKWHLESGIGLLDLTYVGDEVYRIFLNMQKEY